ncbi:AbrB/MazE/SpoVT family DNA-binding domain-containing protein [Hydrocarboniphaga sp.]|uniref:AbrB/MazE/SpoVT family DNA-binding domain-containing protein n=1 Tax=Hydrocarboniphaga sp. TaxID=2033016 RepID=UPI003455E837
MDAVTISPKFQVVIPLAVRQALGLKPGVKMQVVHYQDRVEFIPVRPAKTLRGSLRGISTDVARDSDRI